MSIPANDLYSRKQAYDSGDDAKTVCDGTAAKTNDSAGPPNKPGRTIYEYDAESGTVTATFVGSSPTPFAGFVGSLHAPNCLLEEPSHCCVRARSDMFPLAAFLAHCAAAKQAMTRGR